MAVNRGTVLFTSESVTEGHPDKVCDQISDAVVDACLTRTPLARVACEASVKSVEGRDWAAVFGEATPTISNEEVTSLVRGVLRDIGYIDPAAGTSCDDVEVHVILSGQSHDIAQGVDSSLETREEQLSRGLGPAVAESLDTGAGDQGMMFGYACNETPELMPLPITLAHGLARRLATLRHEGELEWLRPDGKSQVSVEYRDGRPVRVHTVVVSTQHAPEVSHEEISSQVISSVIRPLVDSVSPSLIDERTRYLVNPTGRFVIGGPAGDSGLTGRKIIVDTYGGMARHGGGAFSGKDPTKVDRSAAYAARWVAKNIVASEVAERCEVQLAYAIGVAHPVSLAVDTFGTGVVSDEFLADMVEELFDLRPAAIIHGLDLRRPIYRPTAVYGHFGRVDLDVPWERTDRVAEILKVLGAA
ncbi:MAG: methionine adenosyltransferase [Acidimicrobiales bacterium]